MVFFLMCGNSSNFQVDGDGGRPLVSNSSEGFHDDVAAYGPVRVVSPVMQLCSVEDDAATLLRGAAPMSYTTARAVARQKIRTHAEMADVARTSGAELMMHMVTPGVPHRTILTPVEVDGDGGRSPVYVTSEGFHDDAAACGPVMVVSPVIHLCSVEDTASALLPGAAPKPYATAPAVANRKIRTHAKMAAAAQSSGAELMMPMVMPGVPHRTRLTPSEISPVALTAGANMMEDGASQFVIRKRHLTRAELIAPPSGDIPLVHGARAVCRRRRTRAQMAAAISGSTPALPIPDIFPSVALQANQTHGQMVAAVLGSTPTLPIPDIITFIAL